MNQTSKTGLSSSPTKAVPKYIRTENVQLKAIAKPAPFVLKPYSGLYNPYSNGCSLLCNHPMDKHTKELFRKAKENWDNDEKRNNLLAEEIEVIRTTLSHFSCGDRHLFSQVECVPEELFRRYTDTDSRPLTPAPTLASAATRASGSRRCLTPEARPVHPKARLVLDLRRTHSQDTIPYNVSFQGGFNHSVITRTASLEEIPQNRDDLAQQSPRKAKTATDRVKINFAVIDPDNRRLGESKEENKQPDSKNEDYEDIKRRGKKKKKKPKEPPFHPPTDPETQVATIGSGSVNQSARASLIPVDNNEEHTTRETLPSSRKLKSRPHKCVEADSYLSAEILKQLRRELNEDMVESELNLKRKAALKEALKTIPKDKTDCEELVKLQHELAIPKLNADFWILLPRMFTRSSATFELPMNSSSLTRMTPLDYVRDHVNISPERKLLFNCIFNKFKLDSDLKSSGDKQISGQVLQEALDVLMGRPMNNDEAVRFRSLVGWREDEKFDFRTFSGIAALCERIMASSYCKRLPDRKADPCHEIETADFELLARKIQNQDVDDRLLQILRDIKEL